VLVRRRDLDELIADGCAYVRGHRLEREVLAGAPIQHGRADDPRKHRGGASGHRAAGQPAPAIVRVARGSAGGRGSANRIDRRQHACAQFRRR
jgi:hypothetical protein